MKPPIKVIKVIKKKLAQAEQVNAPTKPEPQAQPSAVQSLKDAVEKIINSRLPMSRRRMVQGV